MKKGSLNHEVQNLHRVRALRSNMSVCEQILWRRLKGRRAGFGFRRQYPVGQYVLDFYCPEARLCVEVDGEQHEPTLERDGARDRWLAERGIETLRLRNLALFVEESEAIEDWMQRIVLKCQERAGRPAFSEGSF